MKKEIRHIRIALAVLAACLGCFWAAISRANTVPPSPTNSFYGDATGDMIIAAADIAQMNLWMLGLPYAYDTLQPQTPTQDWNTSDLTSDRVITAADLSVINNWMLGFPITIEDKPWQLENISLPLTANQPYTWVPFSVNLFSNPTGGPSGRPGLSVVAEIDPSSPTPALLLGRSCIPDSGVRDQQAGDPSGGPYNMGFGAQCALSVTISNWSAGQEQAYTESGTYGLQVMSLGVGTVKINLSVRADPTLDVPAVTLVVNPAFSPQVISPYNNVNVRVSNDAGAFYDDNGNNTYTVAFPSPTQGLNSLHISDSSSNKAGGNFSTTSTSGTFYVTENGGKGYDSEIILLASINAVSLPSNFSLSITASGYRIWTNASEVITSNLYLNPSLSETFGPSDFIYGPQTWKPGPGLVSPYADYPLWIDETVSDPANNSFLVFIDLGIGIDSQSTGLIENGQARVDYVIQNLPGLAAFNAYGYRIISGNMQWTNKTYGLGSSGWRVTLP